LFLHQTLREFSAKNLSIFWAMASADPRHFCFRCNDYAHFNYECPKLNATLSTAERRRQFADTDPSASARDSQRRNTKLSAMEKIRADCATIPVRFFKLVQIIVK
jgi:hypothetical protein